MLTVADAMRTCQEEDTRCEVSAIMKKKSDCEEEARQFYRQCRSGDVSPFTGADSSVGMEFEMQVAVEGTCEDVDLPGTIRRSNFYRNIRKRSGQGDQSDRLVNDLDTYLDGNETKIWENSWVHFAEALLSCSARAVLREDLLADKAHPEQGQRKDASRYLRDGMLRVPASYLLKLSMADAFDNAALPGELKKTAARQLQNLLSDNTSPEILSFSIGRTGKHSAGYLAAAEMRQKSGRIAGSTLQRRCCPVPRGQF